MISSQSSIRHDKLTLEIQSFNDLKTRIEFNNDRNGIVIGTLTTCSYVCEDSSMSPKHGTFECTYNYGIWVYIDHSDRGTIVNGNEHLHYKAIVVHHGDRLAMGTTKFKIQLVPAIKIPPALPSPPTGIAHTSSPLRNIRKRHSLSGSIMLGIPTSGFRSTILTTTKVNIRTLDSKLQPEKVSFEPEMECNDDEIDGNNEEEDNQCEETMEDTTHSKDITQNNKLQNIQHTSSPIIHTTKHIRDNDDANYSSASSVKLSDRSAPYTSINALSKTDLQISSSRKPRRSDQLRIFATRKNAQQASGNSFPSPTARDIKLREKPSLNKYPAASTSQSLSINPYIPDTIEHVDSPSIKHKDNGSNASGKKPQGFGGYFTPPMSPVPQQDIRRQNESLSAERQQKLKREQLLQQQQEQWLLEQNQSTYVNVIQTPTKSPVVHNQNTPSTPIRHSEGRTRKSRLHLPLDSVDDIDKAQCDGNNNIQHETHTITPASAHSPRITAAVIASHTRKHKERQNTKQIKDQYINRQRQLIPSTYDTISHNQNENLYRDMKKEAWDGKNIHEVTQLSIDLSSSVSSSAETVIACYRRCISPPTSSSSGTSSEDLSDHLGYDEGADSITSFTNHDLHSQSSSSSYHNSQSNNYRPRTFSSTSTSSLQ